ncbi:hypothetical protein F7018_09720 [Tenacibaculum aiptasiae]|uniref:Uncharacterized protein n=1 Tax=Tenacibaculum aiptasiae TaxID=426481 RepID=A0A7J5AHW2_9FLAO|nr:hypothetical protein [Tenacibaculum aiptasiae]KAB1157202.1 hypothetical protein F7018_09720 [Tenacibaculum aiptasiae]
MKTIKFLLVASLGVATLLSCTQDKTSEVLIEKAVKTTKPKNLLMYKEVVEMLEHYDETRKPVLEKALGREDTRINFYTIETLEAYLNYVKKISQEKGIKLTGINIVSASYPEDSSHGIPNYQTNIFMPTTEINGRNIAFAPDASKNGEIVTMKEILSKYGYSWVYDSKEDYNNRKIKSKEIQKNSLMRDELIDSESANGNRSQLSPPY